MTTSVFHDVSLLLQHEYQHQLEYTHDDTEAEADSGELTSRPKTKGTLAKHTSGALKGTGHRGRQVAVAADRRRAERARRREDANLGLDGGTPQDSRAAQRARWVTLMQQKQREQHTTATLSVGKEKEEEEGERTPNIDRPAGKCPHSDQAGASAQELRRRRDVRCDRERRAAGHKRVRIRYGCRLFTCRE